MRATFPFESDPEKKKKNNKWIIFVYKENNDDTEELEIKAPSFEQLQSQE